MYSYLFFGLALLSVFSIIENIKWGQKISSFKFHVLIFLFSVAVSSSIELLNELGYNLVTYFSILRLLTIITFVNIFYLVASNKIPKPVMVIEVILCLFYAVAVGYGFKFTVIKDGFFFTEVMLLNKITTLFPLILIFGSMLYNFYLINTKFNPDNLYQVRIKRWSNFLLLMVITLFIFILFASSLYFGKVHSKFIDTRLAFIVVRLLMILFILLRPKFIDETGFLFNTNKLIKAKSKISAQNFDFLFYGNFYYLNSEANLEDFSLKLNHLKSEVLDFIKTQTNESFSELLNKNRIKYFTELIKSKKHQSFTIEALSEMSGFNNRQSMYNAFKKYEGCSPSEYINNL